MVRSHVEVVLTMSLDESLALELALAGAENEHIKAIRLALKLQHDVAFEAITQSAVA